MTDRDRIAELERLMREMQKELARIRAENQTLRRRVESRERRLAKSSNEERGVEGHAGEKPTVAGGLQRCDARTSSRYQARPLFFTLNGRPPIFLKPCVSSFGDAASQHNDRGVA